jgi:uncharacterized protein
MRKYLFVLIMMFCTGTAQAQDTAVQSVVGTVITPYYKVFAETAHLQAKSLKVGCESGDINPSKSVFADLIANWSQIELFRFGPAREDNKYERLFFWPDPRGTGQRQLRKLFSEHPQEMTEPENVYAASVALQGIPALESALYAKKPTNFTCAYATAVAQTIARNADALEKEWEAYIPLILNPSADNPVYKSDQEVTKALLQAMIEQLQVVSELKLEPSLKAYKHAPFWRSDMTIVNLRGNITAVMKMNQLFKPTMQPEGQAYADMLAFELSQADKALEKLKDIPLEQAVKQDAYAYSLIPVKGAIKILTQQYPAALGLKAMGFNSLDGD